MMLIIIRLRIWIKLFELLFDTVYWSLEERDKEGKESDNNKGVECVPPIATATNALNSLK